MSSNLSYSSWELAQGIAKGPSKGDTTYYFAKALLVKKIRGMLVKRGVHQHALKQKAEDAFAEAVCQFLKIWKDSTYQEEGKFIAFFMRLASCAEYNRYSKDKKYLGDGDINDIIGEQVEDRDARFKENFFLKHHPAPAYQAMAEMMEMINLHLPSLAPNQRKVLELRYNRGLEQREIAVLMNKSLSNIKQMDRNAKIRLRQLCKFE